MRRRWKAGDAGVVTDTSGKGIRWRVVGGSKFPDDLVIELQTLTGWFRPPFELAFLLDDFFSENERLRKELDPTVRHWQMDGDRYYASRVERAMSVGYQSPAEETRRDRRASEGPPQNGAPAAAVASSPHGRGLTWTAADFDGMDF